MPSAVTVALVFPPGATTTRPGPTRPRTGTSPSRNEGGTSEAPEPHDVADAPSVKSSRPPFTANDSGSHGFVLSLPFTFRLFTYFTELDAPGAVIVIRCPVARVTVIFGNIGLASTISAR